jgi:hypothetical protein
MACSFNIIFSLTFQIASRKETKFQTDRPDSTFKSNNVTKAPYLQLIIQITRHGSKLYRLTRIIQIFEYKAFFGVYFV